MGRGGVWESGGEIEVACISSPQLFLGAGFWEFWKVGEGHRGITAL